MPGNGKFFGMIRDIHDGKISLNAVKPAMASAATRIMPRDSAEVKRSSERLALALAFPLIVKRANLDGAIARVRKTVQTAGNKRRENLRKHYDTITKERDTHKKELEKSKQELHKIQLEAQQHQFDSQQSQQEAAQAQADAAAAANATMPVGPVPPPAQPAYGNMLTGQPDPNQAQAA